MSRFVSLSIKTRSRFLTGSILPIESKVSKQKWMVIPAVVAELVKLEGEKVDARIRAKIL
jgi:hypothetical protein